jgi:predicted protein tyrosine phosphatase
MRITVMNRSQAIQYCHQQHDEKSVIISIYTPVEEYHDEPFMSTIIDNGVWEILRIGFFDIDGNYPASFGRMTIDDAELIADVVARNLDKHIIVHCDAGQSRSAGIAAALSKYYNDTDDMFFNNPRYVPNMFCYRLMLAQLAGKQYEDYLNK